MRFFRRLISWTCFLGLLLAVGAAVFHFVRHQPRCLIVEDHLTMHHLSHDGSRLAMCRGPFQERLEVIDTATGRAVYTVENFGEKTDNSGLLSPDGCYLASNRLTDTLLVDWQNGQSWSLSTPRLRKLTVTETDETGKPHAKEAEVRTATDHGAATLDFSPTGRWLVVNGCVFDVATRRQVQSQPGLRGFIKGDELAVYVKGANQICLWDLNGDRQFICLTTDIDVGKLWWHSPHSGCHSIHATDDGRWLLLAVADSGGAIWKEGFTNAEVWDLSTQRRKLRIAVGEAEGWNVAFPRMGTNVVFWTKREQDYAVSCIDFAAVEEEVSLPAKASLFIKRAGKPGRPESDWGHLTPDGKLLVLERIEEKPPNDAIISAIDPTAKRVLWETRDYDWLGFSPDGAHVFLTSRLDGSTEKRDARTGAVLTPTPWAGKWQRSADGRIVASREFTTISEWWNRLADFLPAWCLPSPEAIVVAEFDTGRIRCRLNMNMQDSADVILSGDGRTLVTIHDNLVTRRIRVWDVEPHRAWFWAVTAALTAAVVLFLLRGWLKRSKSIIQPKPLA